MASYDEILKTLTRARGINTLGDFYNMKPPGKEELGLVQTILSTGAHPKISNRGPAMPNNPNKPEEKKKPFHPAMRHPYDLEWKNDPGDNPAKKYQSFLPTIHGVSSMMRQNQEGKRLEQYRPDHYGKGPEHFGLDAWPEPELGRLEPMVSKGRNHPVAAVMDEIRRPDYPENIGDYEIAGGGGHGGGKGGGNLDSLMRAIQERMAAPNPGNPWRKADTEVIRGMDSENVWYGDTAPSAESIRKRMGSDALIDVLGDVTSARMPKMAKREEDYSDIIKALGEERVGQRNAGVNEANALVNARTAPALAGYYDAQSAQGHKMTEYYDSLIEDLQRDPDNETGSPKKKRPQTMEDLFSIFAENEEEGEF
jgi:hypothetical protein